MALLSLVRVATGQVSVLPGNVKMIASDNLATITAAGYLQNSVNSPAKLIALAQNDVVECLYSYDAQTGAGTLGYFQPSITNGVITLNIWENPGNVLLPVVSGNLANYNGTAGQIKDAGYKILAGSTTTYGGGGTSNAFTITGLSATSYGAAVIRTSTNNVSIVKAVPTANTLTVTFSADPGASTVVDYIYTTAAAS